MQNVSLQTAVKMTGKSESTLRRDRKKGKVSATRDAKGHLQFDIAELQRAYGELKSTGEGDPSTEQGNGKAMTGHDSAEIIAIKDNQIADLRNRNSRRQRHNFKSRQPRKRNSWIFWLRRRKKSAHSCHRQKKRLGKLPTGCSDLLVQDSDLPKFRYL